MEADYKEKWSKCLDIIRDIVGQERFNTWFSCAKEVDTHDDGLLISLPSHFYFEKYEDDFSELIKRVAQRVFGRYVPVNYCVNIIGNDDKAKVTLSSPQRTPHAGGKVQRQKERPFNPLENEPVKKSEIDSQLNSILTFENYCVGGSNKLPFTIAEYIARNPNRVEFNPFFLYGSVGVGKTHLMQAIGNQIKETVPGAKILFIPMRQFVYLLGVAKQKGNIPGFINWFQNLDVLLIDDLQELAHKSGSMEALFAIFNSLHLNGKKLIFTCDRPPKDLDGITDRLIDRFKWGITEELPKPDFHLRRAILEFKARKNGLDIPADVLDVIADNACGSIREIEGVVMGLLTRSISTGGDITLALAEQVMKHSIRKPQRRIINFDMIVEYTAECFNLNPDVIFSKSRVREIAEARQMIMFLTKKHTGLSLPAIGAKLNRKHTTVLHDIRTMEKKLPESPGLMARMDTIEADLLK